MKNHPIVKLFIESILKRAGYNKIYEIENGYKLYPDDEHSVAMPILQLKHLDILEKELNDYLDHIHKREDVFSKVDVKGNVLSDDIYLFFLVKSLTNSDCEDFLGYVKRFNAFLSDKTFKNFEEKTFIGKLDEYDLYARKVGEVGGYETPNIMQFFIERKGLIYRLPYIRYGIKDNVAYIYTLQQPRKYNHENCNIKKVENCLKGVNRGLTKYRDISPYAICSLSLFCKICLENGIDVIKAPDFLTRRYLYYLNAKTEGEKNEIQKRLTNKFLKTFIRFSKQCNAPIITLPNEVDSYLTLDISCLSPQNEVLKALLQPEQSLNSGHILDK